jgi:hypothetical protein
MLFSVQTSLGNLTFSGNLEKKMLDHMLPFYPAKNITSYSDKNTAAYFSKKCSMIRRFFRETYHIVGSFVASFIP